MRAILFATLLFAVMPAIALAQDQKSGAKPTPTDDAVIELVGGRLMKVFAKFGTPVDVYAYRGATEARDGVTLDFGTFGFDIREKIARDCKFWPEWKGTVRGIKLGDLRETVVKKLGDKFISDNGGDGLETLTWDLKDQDLEFQVEFDKDHKSTLVRVRLK